MNSYKIPPFRSHTLLRGGHRQTVFGALWGGARPPMGTKQYVVALGDGDATVLHDNCPAAWQPEDPFALLMHGLAGCHRSGYLVRVAEKLRARGFRTFRMDHRGAGAAFHLAKLPYHAGIMQDAVRAWRAITAMCPAAPGALVGFSLSGNVVLRALATSAWPDGPPSCAVAVNPPIDLAHCARSLASLQNRLYERRFVKQLQQQLARRLRDLPEAPRPIWQAEPRTIRAFDDGYTAPVWGFDGADDYYAQCSSKPMLAAIRVPTLLLTAGDDSLVPARMFEDLPGAEAVTLHVATGGGHLGYIARKTSDPDRRWMDWRIVEWLVAHATAK